MLLSVRFANLPLVRPPQTKPSDGIHSFIRGYNQGPAHDDAEDVPSSTYRHHLPSSLHTQHWHELRLKQECYWSVNNYAAVSESGNVGARPGFRPLQITGVGGGFRDPHVSFLVSAVAHNHTLPFSLFLFFHCKKRKKDVNLNCRIWTLDSYF